MVLHKVLSMSSKQHELLHINRGKPIGRSFVVVQCGVYVQLFR